LAYSDHGHELIK
jgi:CCR4-NOT transcription complex subunit 3